MAPPEFDEGLACHNDLNLDNVIFRDGRAAALIDFDWANPGSPVWDVAGAVRLWAPLRPDRYIDDARRGAGLDRMRTFVAAYGVELDPERLVRAVRLNHDRMYRLIEDGADAGIEGFAAYWARGRAAGRRDGRPGTPSSTTPWLPPSPEPTCRSSAPDLVLSFYDSASDGGVVVVADGGGVALVDHGRGGPVGLGGLDGADLRAPASRAALRSAPRPPGGRRRRPRSRPRRSP